MGETFDTIVILMNGKQAAASNAAIVPGNTRNSRIDFAQFRWNLWHCCDQFRTAANRRLHFDASEVHLNIESKNSLIYSFATLRRRRQRLNCSRLIV